MLRSRGKGVGFRGSGLGLLESRNPTTHGVLTSTGAMGISGASR